MTRNEEIEKKNFLITTEQENDNLERLIEKACEWLKDNTNDYLDWYDWKECRIDADGLLYNFNKAMKEL